MLGKELKIPRLSENTRTGEDALRPDCYRGKLVIQEMACVQFSLAIERSEAILHRKERLKRSEKPARKENAGAVGPCSVSPAPAWW